MENEDNVIIPPLRPLESSEFYAYYNKSTNELLAVTNEKINFYPDCISVTKEDYEKFVISKEPFSDYIVGYARTPDNKTVLALVQKSNQGYSFKNNVFEWITEQPDTDTELVVEWSASDSQWLFSLSESAKVRASKDLLEMPAIVFFVILENDFDFLIRTIIIELDKLIEADKYPVSFTTNLENRIDKISIASKITFQSYGLIIHE